MKRFGTLFAVAVMVAGPGCGGIEPTNVESTDETLVEDAAFLMGMNELEEETLEEVPIGDPTEVAAEEAERFHSPWHTIPRDCSHRARVARIISLYDEDGDGELNDEERRKLREDFGPRPKRMKRIARHHKRRQLHWIYDEDGSGELEPDERAELRADLEARCEAGRAYALENYDANDDGVLDDDEFAVLGEDRIAKRDEKHAEILANFDRNGDERLGPAERHALAHYIASRQREKRDAVFAEFDVDDSGDLDDDEVAVLREAMRARIRGEHFGK